MKRRHENRVTPLDLLGFVLALLGMALVGFSVGVPVAILLVLLCFLLGIQDLMTLAYVGGWTLVTCTSVGPGGTLLALGWAFTLDFFEWFSRWARGARGP